MAGLPFQNEQQREVPEAPPQRPLSLAWISDELLEETRRVWSKAYGRVLSAEEAVEILMNVKAVAEVLVKPRPERKVE